jgi:hypothetical protein
MLLLFLFGCSSTAKKDCLEKNWHSSKKAEASQAKPYPVNFYLVIGLGKIEEEMSLLPQYLEAGISKLQLDARTHVEKFNAKIFHSIFYKF